MEERSLTHLLKPVAPTEEESQQVTALQSDPLFNPDAVVEADWDPQYLAKNIGVVRDTMRAVRGGVVDDWDDEELQDKNLSTMRAFESGNSIATLRFLQGMNGADEETLSTIGQGIQLFDEMPSAFGEGATWADTRQALGDYTQSILSDPANLIGLGLGKLAVGAGAKAVGTAAKIAGVKAMKIGGEKAANTAFKAAVAEAGKKTVEGIARRTAETQAKKGLGKLTTKTALKDAGVALATDTFISVGIEAARQLVRSETGAQQDFELSQVALAALGTMVVGGAAWGSNLFRGSSGFTPTVRALNEEADTGNVLNAVLEMVETSGWKSKVEAGKKLDDLDTKYWVELLDTMLPAMEREGYVWVRTDADDKVSNFIADVLRTAEPEDAIQFAEDWTKKTGIELPTPGAGGLEDFANAFARKMNESAQVMNRTSQIARKLGIDEKGVTLGHLTEDMLEGIDATPYFQKIFKATAGKTSRGQNNIIRLIVSNLSTTRLNLVGYGASTTINSVSDVAQAVLYDVGGRVAKVLGKMEPGEQAIRTAKVLRQMQSQKVRNLIDPNTTLDQFLAYTQMRPRQLRELTSVLQGGIEDPNAVAKNFGVRPGDTVLGSRADQVVEIIQGISFVQAQDVYTKSQEFVYHLDKKLRLAFNRPMADLMADPDLRKLMANPKWAKAEADAVYETQRAIYSQTFRRSSVELGRFAAFIEDFRNIPGLGLLIPFGRFFNNVLATTMDMSGLAIVAKAVGGYSPNRSMPDLIARAAVGWTGVSILADREDGYIDRGLGVFESENERGEIVDNRYTYPLSLFKGVARLIAHHRKGEEPPENVVQEMLQHLNVLGTIVDVVKGTGEVPPNVPGQIGEFAVGQLTRDLSEAGNDMMAVARSILSGEDSGLLKLIAAPGVAAISGATRFLEPVNIMAKIVQGANMSVMDPKDGNETFNKTFRYLDTAFTTSDVVKYDAASGKRTPQADKFLADRSSKLTNTERVLNLVGINSWDINEYSDSAAANNMFVKYYHSFLEDRATKLMAMDKFRNGDLETKQYMWKSINDEARKRTKAFMEMKSGDAPTYKLIIDINNSHSRKDIAQAMEQIAPGMEMEDMNAAQMMLLKARLDNRDEFLRLKR